MTLTPVLILGARSDMALAVAHRFAAAGHPIRLAARDPSRLEDDRSNLALRHGVDVSLHDFDILDVDQYGAFLDGFDTLPGITLCAVGLMGDQAENERDLSKAALILRSNFEAPALILAEIANRYEAAGGGTIIGISSVAGERGRATNYIYGASKAAFTAYLSGLRNRLAQKGVHVLTVLPGFVATRMTEGLDLPAKLTAQPAEVGEAIFAAVTRKRNVIYVRPVWWLIMAIIRNIPEAIFKKLKL